MIAESIIQSVIDSILDVEGGIEDDAADKGGLTNFGITQKTADELGLGDVRKLTLDQARAAYRKLIDQWNITNVPDVATFKLLADICTNNGATNAWRWAQRAIGVPLDHVDGQYGPETQRAIDAVTDWSQPYGMILAQRIVFYGKLAAKYPDQAKYIVGWLNRCSGFLIPFPKWP